MLAEEKKESGGRLEESRRDPQDERKYLIRRRVVSIVSFLILIGFFAVVAVYVGKPMINLAKDPETFRLWVDSHGFGGKLAMVGMMVLQVVVAVIPGEALEIGAGYAFGAWEGLHYTKVRELYPEDYRAMMNDWVHCPSTGGEIFLDFNARVLDTWKGLHINENENVLFVGHGGPIQCIMCHLLGMDPSAIWHLEIRQGTYTKFGIYKDFPVLKGMNLERREILE